MTTCAATQVLKWNGSAWTALDSGTQFGVSALAVLQNGNLAVGGSFALAGGNVSAFLAQYGCAAQACYANCDSSTTAPILNVADFTCFLQAYANQDPYANCDGSTAVPVLNVGDFTCFLQKYAAGCP